MTSTNGEYAFEGSSDKSFASKAIHTGHVECKGSRPLVDPIYMAANYLLDEPNAEDAYFYSRWANPNRDGLEQTLAALDGGKYGSCFSSGIGTLSSVIFLLKAGDHIICGEDIYGGTHVYMKTRANQIGLEHSMCDLTVADNIRGHLKVNTRMVWLESPTNPTMKLCDISAIAAIIKAYNKDILLVVDNTFMSSYFQRPLELGADLSMQSLTKYMNGHSDVVMGGVTTNSLELHKKLKLCQRDLGAVPSPFDCYLVRRGIKTLEVRMKTHQSNAIAVAKYLASHKQVLKTVHPGLDGYSQRELAFRQCSGFSGMVAFYINGDGGTAFKFVKALKVVKFAVSLGGIESLVQLPAKMSHSDVSDEVKLKTGMSDNLIRMSVGIESIDDLIDDLNQAFKAVF